MRGSRVSPGGWRREGDATDFCPRFLTSHRVDGGARRQRGRPGDQGGYGCPAGGGCHCYGHVTVGVGTH